ncbi:response regulator transcription factor [Bacteroidota bacterium]
MKILVIEDELALLDSIKSYLNVEGYVCEAAPNYETAIEKLSLYQYNCILVDLNLPDGSGFDIIKDLKSKNIQAGVIIISARDTLDDRIKGLEIGADDYLIKPFNLAELNARIKSLYRRMNFKGSSQINAGEIEINQDEYRVFIKGSEIEVTKKEYDLLMFFISNPNRVVTKEIIAEHLWGDYIDTHDSFDFVYTHIKNLRKKLQDKGVDDYIKNIYGVGYKFQIT